MESSTGFALDGRKGKKMRLIDADELIEIAHRIRLDSREQIERMIETAPTVDPVKHGYWECKPLWKHERLEHTTANYYRCSVCHHPAWGITDYCPHCGSKMDEVKYE